MGERNDGIGVGCRIDGWRICSSRPPDRAPAIRPVNQARAARPSRVHAARPCRYWTMYRRLLRHRTCGASRARRGNQLWAVLPGHDQRARPTGTTNGHDQRVRPTGTNKEEGVCSLVGTTPERPSGSCVIPLTLDELSPTWAVPNVLCHQGCAERSSFGQYCPGAIHGHDHQARPTGAATGTTNRLWAMHGARFAWWVGRLGRGNCQTARILARGSSY